MLAIAEPQERFLSCGYLIPDNMVTKLKVQVKKFMASKTRDDLHYKFINWKRKENELIAFTTYAYQDIALPKQYDIVFQKNNPDNYIETTLIITQVVMNGWAAIDSIEHGYKHIVIMEFPNSIPTIFGYPRKRNVLNLFSKSKDNFPLCFCNKKDFENIKEGLLNTTRK